MANTTPQSPEEFRLESVTLTSDRFPRSINLQNISIEFNVFEDIRSPFLTGSLIVLDDNQLYDSLQIQGTERINIVLSLGDRSDQIEKNFVITQVAKSFKTNDYSTVLQFDLIEDIGYLNNLIKFSRMYDGKGERIIEKIIRDHIRKPIANIDNTIAYETFQESYQAQTRFLPPYITPFNAIKLILDKITTEAGSPYYFYSTFVNDNLFLADLETILLRTPFNENRPFIFSQSQTNARTGNDFLKQSYSIYNVDQPNVDDTLLLAELGGISSIYTNINTTTGEVRSTRSVIFDAINRLKYIGVIPENDVIPIDQVFIPDPSGDNERKLVDYVSRHFHEVSASTYPYNSGTTNWTEETQQEYFLRVQKYALQQLLLKNTQRITVPGFWFLKNDPRTTVGNLININVFKNNPEAETGDTIDPKRSGNFMMTAKRHTFNISEYKHLCTIECVRLTYPEVA